jgi:hypothetical protein
MPVFRSGLLAVGMAVLVAASDPSQPSEPGRVVYDAVGAAQGPGAGPSVDVPSQSDARIQRGFELAPVPLDLAGKNPALVGLGSYLAHIHACSGCHTEPAHAPGGDPYLGQPEQVNVDGYMAGGRQFGPFRSRNITPRANGLPGGLTREEFMLVMRTGADFEDGKPALQVMPWPYTRHMTDQELHAIYEYLRAIPCRFRADQSPARCGA